MKKIFGFLAATLLLVSCSNDDDKGSSNIDMDKLLKKWYPVSYRISGATIPYDDHEECGNDYLEFMEDGTMKYVDVWDCEDYIENGTYTVDGKEITITMYEETETATVTKLTNTDLEIKYYDEDFQQNVTEVFKSSL